MKVNGKSSLLELQDEIPGGLSSQERCRRKFTYLLLFLLALVLLSNIGSNIPAKQGDGWEYLGMTISLARHWSPELKPTDVSERRVVVSQWPNSGWQLPSSLDYAGYYQAKNGNWYCYHFWLYSTICAAPYAMLTYLGINPLNVFQITNTVLLLCLILWIFFRFRASHRTKIWLFLVVFISPILFYIPWSHPEVFIYTFFLGGLLDFLNGRHLTGTLITAIASTQSPPILIVSGVMILYCLFMLLRKRQKLTWSVGIMLFGSIFLMCLPYAFYWVFFGKTSLIAGNFASLSNISFTKILSLFVDPNFGFIIYVPLLLFICILLVFKKYPIACFGVLLLAGMALISSTQQNWNSGMMYIHRYAIWLLPLLIVSSLGYFDRLSYKKLAICIALWLSTTGAVTTICLRQSEEDNYLKFSPIAQAIMAIAPGIYDPPYEVFAERALGQEIAWLDRLPVAVTSSGEIRKELLSNPDTGKLTYLNGPILLNTSSNLKVFQSASSADIAHLSGGILSWGPGWYPLEQGDQSQKWRWIGPNSEFEFIPAENIGLSEVSVTLRSFYEPRLCTIIINGAELFQGVISPSLKEFAVRTVISPGINILQIIADTSGVPVEIKGLNSNDTRPLSFLVTELNIISMP